MDKLAINSRETQVVGAIDNVRHLAAAAQRERDIPAERAAGNYDDWGTCRVNLQVLRTTCEQALRQIELTMEQYRPGELNLPAPADPTVAEALRRYRRGNYISGANVEPPDSPAEVREQDRRILADAYVELHPGTGARVELSQRKPARIAELMTVLCDGIGDCDYDLNIDSSDNDNDSGEIYIDAPASRRSFVIKVNETAHEPE